MSKKFFAIGAICLLCLFPSVLLADDGGAADTGGETVVDIVVDLFDEFGEWVGSILPSNNDEADEEEEGGGEGSPDYTGSVDPVG